MFDEEFGSFNLQEQNELVLYCKFYLKNKIRSENDTKNYGSRNFEIMRQLSEFENKLIQKFKKEKMKYIKIQNELNYNFIQDKYPEVFI